MKRSVLFLCFLFVFGVLVACSSPSGGNPGAGPDGGSPEGPAHVGEDGVEGGPAGPQDPHAGNGGSAPPAPGLPELNPNTDGGLEILEMRIISENAAVVGTNLELTVELPEYLEGSTIKWSSERSVGPAPVIGEFTPPRSNTTSWQVGNIPGKVTITATATLGAIEKTASTEIWVTKSGDPALEGPLHVGFFNPADFTVIHAPGATVEWVVSDSNESKLDLSQDGFTATWEATTWRNKFYTITATVTGFNVDDPDAVVVLTREFSTSFCSTGRTNDLDKPCGIENIHQLAGIHNWLDGHFKLLKDIDASETEDWILDGVEDRYGFWPLGADPTQDPQPFGSPMRNITTSFSGTFDGGGHTISNLHIVWPGTIGVGLFGFVKEGAVIQNVHLVDAIVVGYEFVGGIAGRLDGIIAGSSVTDSTIEFAGHGRDCSSEPNFLQGDRVGGVVGLLSSRSGAMTESYALRTNVTGCTWVGGLAGIIAGEVMDSYSLGGTVNAPATLANGERNYWRGGFTGHLTGNGGVARTFALMAGNVAFVGTHTGDAILAQSYWSSDYPGAAADSLNAQNISAANFATIAADGWDAWQLGNDGPGDFTELPDLKNNSR